MSKGRCRSILLRTVANSHAHAQAGTVQVTSSKAEVAWSKAALEGDKKSDEHPNSMKAKMGVEELTVASCYL